MPFIRFLILCVWCGLPRWLHHAQSGAAGVKTRGFFNGVIPWRHSVDMEGKMDLVRERVVQVAAGGIKTPVAVPVEALVSVKAEAVEKVPAGRDKVKMETLIFLSPFAVVIASVSTMAGLFCMIMLLSEKDKMSPNKDLVRRLTRWFALCASVILISAFVACSWEGYKQVLKYRVINSETSEKAIKNINKLMDFLGDKLER